MLPIVASPVPLPTSAAFARGRSVDRSIDRSGGWVVGDWVSRLIQNQDEDVCVGRACLFHDARHVFLAVEVALSGSGKGPRAVDDGNNIISPTGPGSSGSQRLQQHHHSSLRHLAHRLRWLRFPLFNLIGRSVQLQMPRYIQLTKNAASRRKQGRP